MAADGYRSEIPTRPIANNTALSYILVLPHCLTNHITQHVALPMRVVEELSLVDLAADSSVSVTNKIRPRTSTSPLPFMGSTEDARVLTAWEIILSADGCLSTPWFRSASNLISASMSNLLGIIREVLGQASLRPVVVHPSCIICATPASRYRSASSRCLRRVTLQRVHAER